MGYSIGALVIIEALQDLCRDDNPPMGIIEDVLLCGLPAHVHPLDQWKRMRVLVAGRFIHGYSNSDWVLQFLFRGTSMKIGDIAGLVPLQGDGLNIENVDLSDTIKGHLEYANCMPKIMAQLDL